MRDPSSRVTVWRSPEDQPRWVRPLLLAIAALAGLSYSWGIGNFPLESFYGAAARSMGSNWNDFFVGAVDPAGTVSLDKLPGAFWVQALSVRLFGFHYWSVALPQAVAGVLTVLVLYRAVRRVAGPKAGMLAALVLAASPVTVLLNRGNVSDSLLVLLTVLAADAATAAVTTGRLRTLVLAGVWLGLAFQTKMMQAWLIAPALFFAYLVAAPPILRRRLGHVALAGLTMVVVSLSWMSVVAAVPGNDRPYVDGTMDNSIFVQVFVYNGWTRIGVHTDAEKAVHALEPFLMAAASESINAGTKSIPPSPKRLLVGALGRDAGWLLPTALVSIVGVLLARRRRSRQDPVRAAVILWGSWLVILAGFFSFGRFVNSYYIAALDPAIAALSAVGLAVSWRTRATSMISRVVLIVLVPLTTFYAVALVATGSGTWWWIIAVATVVSAVATEALILTVLRGRRGVSDGGGAFSLATLSMLLVPAITAGVVVVDGLGSFSTPYQSASATYETTIVPEQYQANGGKLVAYYDRWPPGSEILIAEDTGVLAAPKIMVTGREFLPIGGYLGVNPSPTLAQLQHLVDTRQVSQFVVPIRPAGSDPRVAWVRAHCKLEFTEPLPPKVELGRYDC